MTTLENRPKTALLVIDVQNGVVEGNHERDAVVANDRQPRREGAAGKRFPSSGSSTERRGACRRGATKWRIVPELAPDDAEPLDREELRRFLRGHPARDRAVGVSVSDGSSSSAHRPMPAYALPCTARFVRGYDATLVSDAHTTEDLTPWGAPPPDQVIAHTNLYWTYQTAPGRTAGTVETKEVEF